MDIKPMPKLDLFGSASKSHSAALSTHQFRNPRNFNHIMSPVGMYIKNTANTPLISSIKTKHGDIFNQKLGGTDFSAPTDFFPTPTAQAKIILPKKAYISSSIKHVVDERTNFKVPGGNKIHKYVDECMMPAVIKHDGKMHLNPHAKKETHHNLNDSLKDLSMMSGDVSLYTIKDARKF